MTLGRHGTAFLIALVAPTGLAYMRAMTIQGLNFEAHELSVANNLLRSFLKSRITARYGPFRRFAADVSLIDP